MQMLDEQGPLLAPGVRKTLVQALAILRGRDVVGSAAYARAHTRASARASWHAHWQR